MTPRPRAPWTVNLAAREVPVWVLPSDRQWTEVEFVPELFDVSKPASSVRASRDLDGNSWLIWRVNTHGTQRPLWSAERSNWIRDDTHAITPFARELAACVQSLPDESVKTWLRHYLEVMRRRLPLPAELPHPRCHAACVTTPPRSTDDWRFWKWRPALPAPSP